MKIKRIRQVIIGFWALACLMTLSGAVYADVAADGRSICAKWKDAVVRVQIVVKLTYSFDGESMATERKMEVVGTVVDPSGLTVVSRSEVDPGSRYGDEEDSGMSSQVTDAKIIMADGKEIPAKVVLRDKDLDLVFLRPVQKPATPMACVDLKDSINAQILDQVLIITRLGTVANRAISACFERIEAVVEKPRKVYSVSLTSMVMEYGSPVFGMNGKLIGIVLSKTALPSSDEGSIPIVLPAEDILSVAKQAPEEALESIDDPVPAAENSD